MVKQNFIKSILVLVIIGLLAACSVSKQNTSPVITPKTDYFTGLLVYDPINHDTLIDINSEKYFTPASTTKLFTLFTALHTLGDSIATFNIYETTDSLYLQPLADPTFLYDTLPNKSFEYIKSINKPIVLVQNNDFKDFIFGNGWQWDDYQYSYMPEKSIMPIYGNVIKISHRSTFPKYFQSFLSNVDSVIINRDFYANQFYFKANQKGQTIVPFKTSLELSATLLADTLNLPVEQMSKTNYKLKPYISTPTLPIYKQLMSKSDNFIAEHLLLMVAKNQTGSFSVGDAIDWSLENLYSDIPQKPRWEDGSGLSRYNLFTPQSMVYLLEKYLTEYGFEFIKDLFPSNTENNALKQWYPFETKYMYAKTGTLSNNHNICGYMLTKKGRLLIFSYMNNHFMQDIVEVRQTMNEQLIEIYNNH